jgi:type I restriction enzyme R subunit
VKKAGPQKLLTDIISLVRFALGKSTTLEPFSETVNERFNNWLSQQGQSGRKFTSEQLEWLAMIKEHIASSLSIEIDDLELSPFYEQGGPIKAYKLFGQDLNKIFSELNEVLAA